MSGSLSADIDRADRWRRAYWLAPVTVMLGSMLTLLPFVATIPILPPFGLMMLIGWRLLRADLFQPWSPLLLGLFDDLISGQPFGSAMFFWTACYLTVDMIDSRLVWRDLWHNWAIGAGAIGITLVGERIVSTPLVANVDIALLLQIVASIALLPLVFRLCAHLGGRGQKT
ncbi:rod shape-determining protein MreD [Stakelama pacifica]|uniref:Rod shape-determining protein MreD n=1 Tax=Stakelama pacifica TaxID=517720 RepID=A0A4R6FY12_9SPHN|nr:rod shape-determining protein MreD [Stakelama pacifica]TDN86831.1 rod shape-determining protein MreD [Stakelama pacifica]GGO90805.1 hypothetical protein GCM10011329_04020 [Stakelama pacifica]